MATARLFPFEQGLTVALILRERDELQHFDFGECETARIGLVTSGVPFPSARLVAVIRQLPNREAAFWTSCAARCSGMPVAASISFHSTTSGRSSGASVTFLHRWDTASNNNEWPRRRANRDNSCRCASHARSYTAKSGASRRPSSRSATTSHRAILRASAKAQCSAPAAWLLGTPGGRRKDRYPATAARRPWGSRLMGEGRGHPRAAPAPRARNVSVEDDSRASAATVASPAGYGMARLS
jgi:hypothetical protein